MVRSIGGITVGNSWMRNNPDIAYPDGHEDMDDATLEKAIRATPPSYGIPDIDWDFIGDSEFKVLDNNFGFWTDTGNTSDWEKAKVYTKKSLTKEELDSIENGNVVLMSA